MAKARAVLFDLDGTFADTAPDLGRALNRLRAEQRLEPLPIAIMRAHASSGARGLLKAGFGLTPESEGYNALRDRFLDLYAENLCVETRLFEGIPELLSMIEARDLPWGIVTNKAKRFTEPLLRALAIGHRAACIVSGDSTPHIKPHPAPLLRAAMLLGLAPGDCLYVGDDLRDVQAARAAGMRFAAAGWGYHGEGGDPGAWGADAVLSRPHDILDLFS
ncbi:MAG: HAD family hydrolase [Betaproteobacteria bacterium]|nr:MAG: HAD family hydrolase [Betaproteobacteria bacterium]TMG76182.1 MAG: HAD family hydrolase [Betaproteobacteria bacterium]